ESFWGWERTYGENGAFAILDQYEQNGQFLYDEITGPPTATMLERESFLVDLQHETYFDIILGNPIDEFDNFIEKWNKLGGEQITKEVNAWYTHNKQIHRGSGGKPCLSYRIYNGGSLSSFD